MTTERTAATLNGNDVLTSKQQDALEACYFCELPILGEVHLSDDDRCEHFCSEKCVDLYDQNMEQEGPEDAAVAQ